MPLPANFDLVYVRGQFLDFTGAALTGTITFTPNFDPVLLDAAPKIIIGKATISTALDDQGKFAVALPASDDPDINPTGWTYTVVEPTGRSYDITVPVSTPVVTDSSDPLHGSPVIELISVVPSPTSFGTVQLAAGPPGPQGVPGPVGTGAPPADLLISVKDYGATGDGTTDDSAAIAAARDAMLSTRDSNKHATRPGLYFPPGQYLVTVPDTLMNATTTTQDYIEGFTVRGAGAHNTTILFRPTGSTGTLTGRNLMTWMNSADGGRVRSFRCYEIGFDCNNPAASFVYSYSTTSSYFHDGIFRDVIFSGSWNRVVGLDGPDASANLNSEIGFHNCGLDVDSTFTDAFFNSACNPGDTSNQQDQFVNYWFRDCRFAWTAGTLLSFPKGGSISVTGGSWSLLGSTCLVFSMPFHHHNGGAQRLYVADLRLELDVSGARVINCEWFDGAVTWVNLDESAVSWQSWAPTQKTHRYDWGANNPFNNGPAVNYYGCALEGYHEIGTGATAPKFGRIRYDGCKWLNYDTVTTGQIATRTGATGLLRWTGTGAPSYGFIGCVGASGNITDVSG